MGEDFLLTPDQIFNLTGYKQSKKQREQLAIMGIPFCLDGADKPVVARETVMRVLGVSSGNQKSSKGLHPNFFPVESVGD